MNSKISLSNTCRYEGCTVTGALAVTAFVPDGISIVHGPSGCTQHNVSLLHSTLMQHEKPSIPRIMTTALGEREIIFGGESALEKAIGIALERSPHAIFVISTCVAGTIGDDINAVCAPERDVPVIPIDCAGFLNGGFRQGFVSALIGLSTLIGPCAPGGDAGVNIIGERNLEVDAEQNFAEVERILASLDIPVNVRYVRNAATADMKRFGNAGLNLFREDPGGLLSRFFAQNFSLPAICGYPTGPQAALDLISRLGAIYKTDCREALREEEAAWEALADDFSDLRGLAVSLAPDPSPADGRAARDFTEYFGIALSRNAPAVPWSDPVGIGGARRLLRQWRRRAHGY
ncbi:MAG: oxalate:formate antiporter [Methanomicrobiales archaeon]|nr:oxalate:formate antiporter [Methanomicrobiales archaeon]